MIEAVKLVELKRRAARAVACAERLAELADVYCAVATPPPTPAEPELGPLVGECRARLRACATPAAAEPSLAEALPLHAS